MQTCPECGSRNEDGELFCGSCGTFLEWEEPQTPDALPADQPSGAAAGPPRGEAAGPEPDAVEGVVEQEAVDEPAAHEPVAHEPAAHEPVAHEPVAELAADERADDERADEQPAEEPVEAPAEEPAAEAPTRRRDRGDGAGTGSAGPGALTGALGAGALGGRASRMLRQTADRATGGAVSSAGATASRARSATRAPGRTVESAVRRGVAQAPLPPAAMSVGAAAAASAPATRGSGATSSPDAPAGGAPPSTRPAPTRPAATPATPAPARPAAAQPAPLKPAARKPGAPAPRRPVPATAPEEPPPRPGDLICGACGAGNAPHRNFCRRCGASLADAPVQPERSWWRRLLRPDPKPGPTAGTRPRSRRRRRFPTGAVATLVVLGLLGGAAWYFRDNLAGAYDAVLDRVSGDDPINPSAVAASSELADRPAAQVRDGISNRVWSPAGEGPGEWVELALERPYRVVALLVTAGNGPEDEQRLLEARPERVRLTFTTTDGQVVQDVTLTDAGGAQSVPAGVSGVEAVRLTVLSVYGADTGGPVSFAEVELRGRG